MFKITKKNFFKWKALVIVHNNLIACISDYPALDLLFLYSCLCPHLNRFRSAPCFLCSACGLAFPCHLSSLGTTLVFVRKAIRTLCVPIRFHGRFLSNVGTQASWWGKSMTGSPCRFSEPNIVINHNIGFLLHRSSHA